jgi:leader peptidase (prepilin peptidase) / N-methyltransferase
VRPLLIAGLGILGFIAAWPQRAAITAILGHAAQNPGRPEDTPGDDQSLGDAMGNPAGLAPPAWSAGLVTAVLLAAIGYRVHPWPVLAAAAWLVICGVPLALIDARAHRLPDVLTAAAYAGVLTGLIIAAGTTGAWGSLGRAAAGGAALSAFYLAAAFIRPDQVGLGDGKAAASAGSLMAWFGWPALAGGTIAALLLGGAYGLVLLAARRATLQTRIAFGPALLGGALVAVLVAAR